MNQREMTLWIKRNFVFILAIFASIYLFPFFITDINNCSIKLYCYYYYLYLNEIILGFHLTQVNRKWELRKAKKVREL